MNKIKMSWLALSYLCWSVNKEVFMVKLSSIWNIFLSLLQDEKEKPLFCDRNYPNYKSLVFKMTQKVLYLSRTTLSRNGNLLIPAA